MSNYTFYTRVENLSQTELDEEELELIKLDPNYAPEKKNSFVNT
jgi:hypothetical protein